MASAEFSEFTFGFAFTRELVEACADQVVGAPRLPSLYDEGKTGGFDVSVGLLGRTYFAQFKCADFLTRSNASYYADHGGPYYRFPITRQRTSAQHEMLLALEEDQDLDAVEYVAPRFHTNSQLNERFTKRSIIADSMRIRPAAIGRFDPPDLQHFVTYQQEGPPTVRSEPRQLQVPYDGGVLVPSLAEADAVRRPLDAALFDRLASNMMAIAGGAGSAPSVDVSWLERLDGMSAFGRARTAARVLFGGELVPLVLATVESAR